MMEQIEEIAEKYSSLSIRDFTTDFSTLKSFSVGFSKDLLTLCDVCSRIIDFESRPNYYNINEATIVGTITRIIKIYTEAIKYYEEDKGEIYYSFLRPVYESLIIMKYLIRNGESSQKNFRLISYQARLQNYKKLIKLDNQNDPLIKRQLNKLNAKLKLDNFIIEDLEIEDQKKGHLKWKLDGKSFHKIHKEIENTEVYSFIYGGGSDFVHGNWQEILDFHLTTKGQGFIGFLNYQKCDCRSIVPLNRMLIQSAVEFLLWNNNLSEKIKESFAKMKDCNTSLYLAYEKWFGEPS